MSFERTFAHVVMVEGGFSDHAADRGGKTMFGVTERVARANGYQGDMRNFTIDDARMVFKAQYWDTLRLDDVDRMSAPIALELFDTSVNMGVAVAGGFLQRALNAFNRNGLDYPDLKADGVVGPMTVDTLKSFVLRRPKDGEAVMLKALNSLQGARYVAIAEADHTQEEFAFGWFKNRVAIA